MGLILLRTELVEGVCKHGTETYGSLKCSEILEPQSEWLSLNKGSFVIPLK
jgi:hypothetical protein